VDEDFSMSTDLAKGNPDKLAEMQDLWLAEALKYDVLPMDDRRQELFDPKVAGRPDIMFGRKTLTLYEGMGGLLENDFINTKSTSWDIVADIETTESKTNGVIFSKTIMVKNKHYLDKFEWICTDPDNNQYMLKEGQNVWVDTKYKFKQETLYLGSISYEEFTVDLINYSYKQITDILISFGYIPKNDYFIYATGDKLANDIIAECVFEFRVVAYACCFWCLGCIAY
jgi:hypothetical protein